MYCAVFIRCTTAVTRCQSLPFIVTLCYSLYHSLSLFVTRCHSLSFVLTRYDSLYHSLSLVVIYCHSLYHSLSLVVIRCYLLYPSLSFVVIRFHSIYHSSVFLSMIWSTNLITCDSCNYSNHGCKKRENLFSCDYLYALIKFLLDLLYYKTDFINSNKQASEDQKIKSVYKMGLNYTICKLFKNCRKQTMFRIWSSILM